MFVECNYCPNTATICFHLEIDDEVLYLCDQHLMLIMNRFQPNIFIRIHCAYHNINIVRDKYVHNNNSTG